MTAEEIEGLFAQTDGGFQFARWGRPIAPVVFGVDDRTLETFKGAVEAVASLAGSEVAETDPELGANFMVFFCRDWSELLAVPNLGAMIPALESLVERMANSNATRYRTFRRDETGAIKACFLFIRVDDEVAKMPADALCLGEAVQMILLWGQDAFTRSSPIASAKNVAVLKPEIAALIRAAYDATIPVASNDSSLAMRFSARVMAALSV